MKKMCWKLLILLCAGICMLWMTACTGGNRDPSGTDTGSPSAHGSTGLTDSAPAPESSNDLPILWE